MRSQFLAAISIDCDTTLKHPVDEQDDDPSQDDPFIAWNEDFTPNFVAILKRIYQRYPQKNCREG